VTRLSAERMCRGRDF